MLSAGGVDSETSIATFLNDPDVNEKVDYLFVGLGSAEANALLGKRCVVLHESLLRHKINHVHYVGGNGGHEWATLRHLLYYRSLPGLWRTEKSAN